MEKNITLTVNGQPLRFLVTTNAHNKYTNELLPTNKVAPAENYLRRTVQAEDKEALNTLLENPSYAVIMAAQLADAFIPDIEIEVGK